MTEPLVAVTAVDSESDASRIAEGLVDARLAACVQISAPVRSVYRWQGEICDEAEWQLWIKTTAERRDELSRWIAEHHGYDVPELIFLPIVGGHRDYLDWLVAETAT